jgi:hypothetical protein
MTRCARIGRIAPASIATALTGCNGPSHISADEFVEMAERSWTSLYSASYVGHPRDHRDPRRVYLEVDRCCCLTLSFHQSMYWTELPDLPPKYAKPIQARL